MYPRYTVVSPMRIWPIDKPDAFRFCGPMRLKYNFLAGMSKGTFGEERAQNLMKRTSVQLLSMGVDQSCFGVVLQPVAQGTFHE